MLLSLLFICLNLHVDKKGNRFFIQNPAYKSYFAVSNRGESLDNVELFHIDYALTGVGR